MLKFLENYMDAPLLISWMIDIFGICALGTLCYSMGWLTKRISDSNRQHTEANSPALLPDASLFHVSQNVQAKLPMNDIDFIAIDDWPETDESETEATAKVNVTA